MASLRPGPVALVLCGSFNPPTVAHLRMLDLARDAFRDQGIDVVRGILSPVNDAYGKPGLAPASHRLAMTRLAAAAHGDWVACDPWEAEQPEYVRTLEVLRRAARELRAGPEPHARPVLLCGADLLQSFARPGVWLEEHLSEILTGFGVACVTRDGSDPTEALATATLAPHRHGVLTIHEPVPNHVSSTAVRKLAGQKRSVAWLVPPTVASYIAEHGLYEGQDATAGRGGAGGDAWQTDAAWAAGKKGS
ncbi:unnamed protein product [Pedinophyceae sp. YPF-701]|nr:unnamed protein product [Pedinophyceae sp. YPF-701]